jgi:hypothetical protein
MSSHRPVNDVPAEHCASLQGLAFLVEAVRHGTLESFRRSGIDMQLMKVTVGGVTVEVGHANIGGKLHYGSRRISELRIRNAVSWVWG